MERCAQALSSKPFVSVNDIFVTCIHIPFCSSEETAGKESVLKVVGGTVMSCYAKYWILVCGGMFIMVSFAGKLVAYKIVYMLMFLICLCLYQVRVFRTYTCTLYF